MDEGLRLGIDTGGTYTDAVLVDARDRIVASAKRLTTLHDLTIGIGEALEGLPSERLAQVGLVALSTTLSTNSVVEGRGAPVCVLLPGYNEAQVSKSGLEDIVGSDRIIRLSGGHDALGREVQPLDEELCRRVIGQQERRSSAFAVSSMFGVRNPAHERQLREWISEICQRPVTCGHELCSSLDAPRRALTVALNARMVPVIGELIKSARRILADRGIAAPLMMVKGDGSLVNTDMALRQPVGTVLSGPAASVIGACALSGADNAIIADMGGTTTDIAIVTDGAPELGSDGVRIGDWQPMVEAVRVISIGLGGDSEVRFSGGRGLEIGPRRVVPLSLLGHLHPETVGRLEAQLERGPGRRDNRFALRLEYNEVLMAGCPEPERRAWERLADGPVELDALVRGDRELARGIARLQHKGLAIYTGFTPTDAAHAVGLSTHWSTTAASLAARLWARQMRHQFGFGGWGPDDAVSPSREVLAMVGQRIGRALIEAGLHQHRRLDSALASGLSGLLADLVVESARAPGRLLDSGALFHLKFAADYPVVAVGAPASTFFPDAVGDLGADLHLPGAAEVANAFGAVMGSIVQRAVVTVTQPSHGNFTVHSDLGPLPFADLEQAIARAREIAAAKAREGASTAGANAVELRLDSEARHVRHDLDGELFLETRVIATATGVPVRK